MAAIYMWLVDEQIILTTTLYPVEVIEKLILSVALTSGSMELIPEEFLGTAESLISASYTQLRWFYVDGPYYEYLGTAESLISASYTQLRWFYVDGPYEEFVGTAESLVSASYIRKKVIAASPDEKLLLSVSINAGCTMSVI